MKSALYIVTPHLNCLTSQRMKDKLAQNYHQILPLVWSFDMCYGGQSSREEGVFDDNFSYFSSEPCIRGHNIFLCRINKNYPSLSPNTPSYLKLCEGLNQYMHVMNLDIWMAMHEQTIQTLIRLLLVCSLFKIFVVNHSNNFCHITRQ